MRQKDVRYPLGQCHCFTKSSFGRQIPGSGGACCEPNPWLPERPGAGAGLQGCHCRSWLLKLLGILACFLPFHVPCVAFGFAGVSPDLQCLGAEPGAGTLLCLALLQAYSYGLGAAFVPSHFAACCVVSKMVSYQGQYPPSTLGTQGISRLHRDSTCIFLLFLSALIFTGTRVSPLLFSSESPFFSLAFIAFEFVCLFWGRGKNPKERRNTVRGSSARLQQRCPCSVRAGKGCYYHFIMCGLRYIPAFLSSLSCCADVTAKPRSLLTLPRTTRCPSGPSCWRRRSLCSLLGLRDHQQLCCHRPVRVHPRHRPQADDHSQPASPHRHQEIHRQGPGPAGSHPGHSCRHPEAAAGPGLLRHGLHAQPPDLQRAGEDGAAQPSLPASRPSALTLRQRGAQPALLGPAVPPARRPAVRLAAAPWAWLWVRPAASPALGAQLWLRAAAGPVPGPVLRWVRGEERLRSALHAAEHMEGRAGVSC